MNKIIEKILIKLTPRFIRRIYRIENQNSITNNNIESINNNINNLIYIVNQINSKNDYINHQIDTLHNIISYSTDFKNIKKAEGILSDIQNISRILLDQFDKIAKEYNIPYWIQGGTLLAAYRQNRFTPWDDDIDIGMMRKDLKKLFKILKNHPIFQVKHFYYMLWEHPVKMARFLIKGEKNFWIDIFAYDYLNKDDKFNEEDIWNEYLIEKNNLSKELLSLQLNYHGVSIENDIDKNRIDSIYDKYISKYSKYKNGNYIIFGMEHIHPGYKRFFTYDMIYPFEKLKFEDNYYPVPSQYEKYIYRQYGDPFKFPRFFDPHFDIVNNYPELKSSIHSIYKKLKEAKSI